MRLQGRVQFGRNTLKFGALGSYGAGAQKPNALLGGHSGW